MGGLIWRHVASFAAKAGIAGLRDVSLLDRLREAGDCLADVLNPLFADRRLAEPPQKRPSQADNARKALSWRL